MIAATTVAHPTSSTDTLLVHYLGDILSYLTNSFFLHPVSLHFYKQMFFFCRHYFYSHLACIASLLGWDFPTGSRGLGFLSPAQCSHSQCCWTATQMIQLHSGEPVCMFACPMRGPNRIIHRGRAVDSLLDLGEDDVLTLALQGTEPSGATSTQLR